MDLRPFQCAQFLGSVKIVVEQDARLSVKDIAICTGIPEGSEQTILKKSVWT